MKGTRKKVTMGSGHVYYDTFTGELPAVADIIKGICAESKRLGYIKNGGKLEYKPSFTSESDDLGYVTKEILTEEEATMSTGLFTWNGQTLATMAATARESESEDGKYRILDIGGVGNDDAKQYVIVFHHVDKTEGDCWVIIVGRNTEGFTIEFAKDSATVIDAVFKCKPQDGEGTLIKYVEEKEHTKNTIYTQESLNTLTVSEIEAIAAERNYTLTGSNKAEKITSFLEAQTAANTQ